MATTATTVTTTARGVSKETSAFSWFYPTDSSLSDRYGRWALLGVILAIALVAFFLVSCLNARRRKKAGNTPYYGTQWLAPNVSNSLCHLAQIVLTSSQSYGQAQQQQQQTQYYPPQNTHNDNAQYAPPAYPAPNGNADYYGNNTTSNNQYEMQQPAATYQPGYNREAEQAAGNEFTPPPGPPPGKAGVFR
jgi:hypothetical protein